MRKKAILAQIYSFANFKKRNPYDYLAGTENHADLWKKTGRGPDPKTFVELQWRRWHTPTLPLLAPVFSRRSASSPS
jgi:hypothetical protein